MSYIFNRMPQMGNFPELSITGERALEIEQERKLANLEQLFDYGAVPEFIETWNTVFIDEWLEGKIDSVELYEKIISDNKSFGERYMSEAELPVALQEVFVPVGRR